MKYSVLSVVLVAGVLTCAAPLEAQLCLRGRPAPECDAFLLTEAGVSLRFNPEADASSVVLGGEYGAMRNLNERNAIGAALYLGFDKEDELSIGFKPRYRRWLSTTASLDLSIGVLWDPSPSEFGITGYAGLGSSVILAMQLDSAPDDGVTFSGGLRLGSYPGLIASIVGGVAFLIYGAAIAAGGD